MYITFVLPDGLGLGGVTTWSVEMAQQLAALGQPACLIEHINPKIKDSIQAPVGVHQIQDYNRLPPQARRKDIPKYLPTYAQALPGVFIPNYSFGTYAACAALSRQQAAQMRVIGFAHTDQLYYYLLLRYYEPMIHRFVAVSQEVAQTLRRWLPHRSSDIRISPYGVRVADALSRSYSQPSEAVRLVYAGRLVDEQKRVFDLIRLAELLDKRDVNFHLRIIGEGSEKSRLLQAADLLGPALRQRIGFEGRIAYEQMPAVWQSADICLLVSQYEGTSISMLEAMAGGCVPVITRVSGAAAVIEPGKNGYWVNVGDMAGMAGIIQQLAAEREQLPRLGLEAYRKVRDHFSLPAYLDWFQSLVNEAWEQPPRPWPARRAPLPRGLLLYVIWNALSALGRRTKRLSRQTLKHIFSTHEKSAT